MTGITFNWRGREPFGPVIVRSRRGVMHRAQPGPRLHVRCAGGRPFNGDVLSPSEAVDWASGREWSLCRYPWCFRDVLEAAGIDPEVGHVVRYVHESKPRPAAKPQHRATPVRPYEHVAGWQWCSCDRIVMQATDAHNPARTWWVHHQ